MADQERTSLQFEATLLVSFFAFILIVDFLLQLGILHNHITGILPLDKAIVAFIVKSRNKAAIIRGGLIISMIALSYLQGERLYQSTLNIHLRNILIAIIICLIFMAGYNRWYYYNIFVYPVIFLSLFYVLPKGFQSLLNVFSSQHPVLTKVSRRKDEFSFKYPTDKGPLWINDIRTATFIEGSAKAGKTASIIIPTIIQAAQNKFAGLIYDYEGDLTEPGGGLLTHVAYTALKKSKTPVKFGILNFTDLSRTMQCNPLSPQYIKSYNHALEMANVIMLNIKKEWSKHKDFWAENAIGAYAATIWFFQRNYPKFCTIPHITEFLLNDFNKILKILRVDKDIAPYIRPILAALEREASGQLAGAESSTQFPLARMRSPEVYYVFNPEPEYELNLDITNLNYPVMLCVCNAPELHNALAPSIGAVIQACKVQMNKLGKYKSIFLFDEMPTIYIDNADKIPAEARKKLVSTFFAVQAYDQLVRDYGVENARVIRNSCGNIFTGITNVESAEKISKMMGEFKKTDYQLTTGDPGNSITQSIRLEKVLTTNDVASQQSGHFSGRILNGHPPYFSAQFKHNPYPIMDIPHFNYPVVLDDIETQEMILAAVVRENYQHIIKDIEKLIAKYQYLFEVNS